MPTGSLDQALEPNGASGLQAMGLIVLTAAMFGRNLLHLHRPGPDDHDEDINGGFWNRHRQVEQILLQTSLSLPDHLRLPSALTDPNIVFANMCLHTSAICLHQAAIFKADKYRLPVNVSNESKIRCVTAAAEIASIMRMISHMDLGAVSHSKSSDIPSLTVLDESLHILHSLRGGTRFRSIPQDATQGPADELIPSVSLTSNASSPPEESPHRVLLGSTRPRPGKRRYHGSSAKTIRPSKSQSKQSSANGRFKQLGQL
jgi:hypothetical protein